MDQNTFLFVSADSSVFSLVKIGSIFIPGLILVTDINRAGHDNLLLSKKFELAMLFFLF